MISVSVFEANNADPTFSFEHYEHKYELKTTKTIRTSRAVGIDSIFNIDSRDIVKL